MDGGCEFAFCVVLLGELDGGEPLSVSLKLVRDTLPASLLFAIAFIAETSRDASLKSLSSMASGAACASRTPVLARSLASAKSFAHSQANAHDSKVTDRRRGSEPGKSRLARVLTWEKNAAAAGTKFRGGIMKSAVEGGDRCRGDFMFSAGGRIGVVGSDDCTVGMGGSG